MRLIRDMLQSYLHRLETKSAQPPPDPHILVRSGFDCHHEECDLE